MINTIIAQRNKNKKNKKEKMKKSKAKAKLRIKPIKYTLMELRKINYCKRKGIPVPQELLDKKFEDFAIEEKAKPPQQPLVLKLEDKEIDKNEANENDQNFEKGESQRMLFLGNVNQLGPTPEQEKVSLIKIGVTPKLGGETPNNTNTNKAEQIIEPTKIQIGKNKVQSKPAPKQKVAPPKKK